jgi:hypothetical protein
MLKYDLSKKKFGINQNISWDDIRGENLSWWETVGIEDVKEKPETKKLNYDFFLQDISDSINFNINSLATKSVGEICCGPYGGILECFQIQAKKKYFIDIFMNDFKDMGLIQWPDNSNFINAPCEHIHLPDNELDVLFGYNSIDHGWDWQKSLDECLRISKKTFIMFDTKDKIDGDMHPQKISHEDVLRYAEEQSWHQKYKYVSIKAQYKDYGYYDTCFDWPETWVYVIK